jgi:hypothetical protein
MSIRALGSCALLAACLAATPAPAAELPPDAEEVAKHLEFLGYQVTRKPDRLEAAHDQHVNLGVQGLKGGTLLIAFLATEDAAKDPARRGEILELVNGFNKNSTLVIFFLDADGDLGASAWQPGGYDKATFGALIDRWNIDIREAIQSDPERSRALLR